MISRGAEMHGRPDRRLDGHDPPGHLVEALQDGRVEYQVGGTAGPRPDDAAEQGEGENGQPPARHWAFPSPAAAGGVGAAAGGVGGVGVAAGGVGGVGVAEDLAGPLSVARKMICPTISSSDL